MFKPKKKELKFSDVKQSKEVVDRSVTEEEPLNEEEIKMLISKVPQAPKEEIEEEAEETEKKQARIVSAKIIEGLAIETVIHSNYSIGEVGEYFEQ